MLKVNLIRYTPEPERTSALAARLCYSPVGVTELEDKLSDSQVHQLVRKLVQLGHLSALEHVSFTFAIEGVSRVLTHQLVRHRIASYSQQSQRYVAERDFEFITPPSVAVDPLAQKRFVKLLGDIKKVYNELVDLGIDKEGARYVLPNAAEKMLAEVRRVAPVLFEKAGPACVTQRVCHEGPMSCGRLAALLLQDEAKSRG